MLSGPFLSKDWIGAVESFDCAKIVMLGVGFDGTCSFIPGSRFAPAELRVASWGLEDYSPTFDKHLEDVCFYDAGDLELPFGNTEKALELIRKNADEIYKADKKYFGIGGEHLVTLPALQACFDKYKDVAVLHFDAHTDLRDDYLGDKNSHASVMRRIGEIIGFDNLKQVGIRSGTKEEFELMKKYNTLLHSPGELDCLKGRNVFVSIDVDVLCPSFLPGTGTQEAGGLTYNELMEWLKKINGLNVVGADVVELAPNVDKSGASTAIVAKIIRELLMVI